MPRKFQLYWDKHNKYWFKKFDGKKVYFGRAKSKYLDPAGYNEAVVKYQEYLNVQRLELEKTQKFNNVRIDSKFERPEGTLAGAIDRYYTYQKEREANGHITLHRLNCLRSSLRTFETFLGRGPTSKLYKEGGVKEHLGTHLALDRMKGYFKMLSRKVKEGSYVVGTAHTHWCIAKDFLKWVYEQGSIDKMPRGLNRYKFNTREIQSGRGQHKVFSVKQVRELFEYSHKYLQLPLDLWICLGLNAGFTAVEIGTLKYEHLVFDEGGNNVIRIKKLRSKTKQYGEWKLWAVTNLLLMRWINKRKLFKRHKIEDRQYVFFGRNGKLIYSTRRDVLIGSGESVIRRDTGYVNDGIGRCFTGMVKAHFPELDGMGFKTFRKCGATAIQREELKNTLLIEQLYLAHKPVSIARKFYTTIDADNLDTGLERIEDVFDLASLIETEEEREARRLQHHNFLL